jgi:polyisoprenoid-binding protein YceI
MRVFLTLALSLSLASSARAAAYTIDAAHSSVSFKIKHLASRVVGSFKDFSGTIEFDEKAPKKASVDATIQTASIDTRNEKRDGHLRSADFFEAEKYPTITFKSKKVEAAVKDKLKVTGDFTMHGVTKPVTLNVEYLGSAKDPAGKVRAGFSATGKLNRKDFGIVWNKALDNGGFILGDDVEVAIEIEAIPAL